MTVYRHRSKWRYDFAKDGIRHRESGFRTKQEARSAESEARKNLKKMNSDFIALCESRLRDLRERRTKKHFSENKSLLEKLILRWHGKKEITRKDVEDYVSIRAKKSHYTANRELRMIKSLFGHGMEREMISYHPAQKIKYYPVSKGKKYIPPLEDIDKVLASCRDRERLYLLAAMNTIARINEINNLKWDDVHEDYVILRTRKSKNSNIVERKIPINATLKMVLDSTPKISEYVFCYLSTGKPYGYRSKMLRRACERAEVKKFGYHALRHYGASKLADSGVPITDIQLLLGHQRVSTTDIYLQSIKPNLKSAMDKL